MQYLIDIFGTGNDLTIFEMTMRGFVLFFFTLVLIRISGRRSFGMNAPFDIIIIILLGSVLSRAVVGASPFWPTISACLVISLLHRIIGVFSVSHESLENWIKGKKIQLFQNDQFIKSNLIRSEVSEEDIMEEVRLSLNQENLSKIEKIYMERNGKISLIKR